MSWVNHDDVLAQLRGAGLILDRELAFDARIQRWKVDGGDAERRGWSRVKEWTARDGRRYLVGSYGVWHGTDDGRQKIELSIEKRRALSDEEREAMRAAHAEALRRLAETRKQEAKTAARWASAVWAACAPVGPGHDVESHDYLARKRIGAHGARVLGEIEYSMLPGLDESNHHRLASSRGALVVPMHDANGNVCGLQFIYPAGHERRKRTNRDKEFWPSGMGMGGTFGLIGAVRRDAIMLVAEGFATAASLHEAAGHSVAYAFSANNLAKAGKALRQKYPRLRLLFCADDDYLTDGNPGCAAAAKATAEIERTAWVAPSFLDAEGRDLREGKKLTDFNDLACMAGVSIAVADQVNAKLDALGWREPPTSGAPPGGGGGGAGDGAADGDDRQRRRAAVSILSLDEVVERFICIDDDTGDFVFDTWTRQVCKASKMIKMLPAGMRADDVKRHPLWIQRAVYIDQVGFDPGGEDRNIVCNRWNGWPTVPRAGNCGALLELLRYLCTGEESHAELFEWVLRWLAYPVQHPGAKMHSALVVHGPQGTGKSRFFEAYARIFGEYGVVLNQGAIEDKFNADWQERKLFVLADEVVANTEKFHLKNQLKNLITGEWVRINPKNVAAHRERNHMNMVFLSNEIMPVVLENDDRRHCVVYTPKKLGDDFYADVTEEIESGGVAALHAHLLALDLGDMKPWSRPPMTQAKNRLILVGAGSDEQFVVDWRDGQLGLPFCPVGKEQLYGEYQAWCRREGETRPRPAKFFWAHVERLGWFVGVRDRLKRLNDTGSVSWRCCIPTDEALDLAYARRRGPIDIERDYRRRPDETQSAWLCRCYWAVDDAISARRDADRGQQAA